MAIDVKIKEQIDAMTHYDLAYAWRFAPTGDLRLQGEAGAYFKERFDSLGGFTPALSKQIGWGE